MNKLSQEEMRKKNWDAMWKRTPVKAMAWVRMVMNKVRRVYLI